MAKYKIKVIQHLLKGNQIASSGDIVDESKFINLKASIDGGFVVLHEEKQDDIDDSIEIENQIKLVKSLSKPDLIQYATDNEIDVDDSASKKEILAVIIESIENQKL